MTSFVSATMVTVLVFSATAHADPCGVEQAEYDRRDAAARHGGDPMAREQARKNLQACHEKQEQAEAKRVNDEFLERQRQWEQQKATEAQQRQEQAEASQRERWRHAVDEGDCASLDNAVVDAVRLAGVRGPDPDLTEKQTAARECAERRRAAHAAPEFQRVLQSGVICASEIEIRVASAAVKRGRGASIMATATIAQARRRIREATVRLKRVKARASACGSEPVRSLATCLSTVNGLVDKGDCGVAEIEPYYIDGDEAMRE